jgi:hypothetical protein
VVLGAIAGAELAAAHAERGIHLVATDHETAAELAVQVFENGGRRLDVGVAVALDEHLVATADDRHRQLLFDPGEVDVVLAEQRRTSGVVVETNASAGAAQVVERAQGLQA